MHELDSSHHIFRHIKKSWMEGDSISPFAFRLSEKDGQFEEGLSVNWVEYFETTTAQEAVAPLRELLVKKGRKVGGESKFALLNVGQAKTAAATYVAVSIVRDEEEDDASHALVKGYEAFNDQVALELSKVVVATFPAKP
jgi:hypothetical protein